MLILLPDCGGEEDSSRIPPTRALHGVHPVVLDLRQLELDLVPVDGLHREVGGVRDQVIVRSGDTVHENMEAWRHL